MVLGGIIYKWGEGGGAYKLYEKKNVSKLVKHNLRLTSSSIKIIFLFTGFKLLNAQLREQVHEAQRSLCGWSLLKIMANTGGTQIKAFGVR